MHGPQIFGVDAWNPETLATQLRESPLYNDFKPVVGVAERSAQVQQLLTDMDAGTIYERPHSQRIYDILLNDPTVV